jgi:hypothetical protein
MATAPQVVTQLAGLAAKVGVPETYQTVRGAHGWVGANGAVSADS